MKVDVINRQSEMLIDPKRVREIVKAVIRNEGQRADEMAVYFVETTEICSLHEEFFDDPGLTDCISFPMDSPEETPRFLGEVFICPSTAIQYCLREGGDPRAEATLYLVHGLLHLMGYDDIETRDRKVMRAEESKHMELLRAKNLIL